MQPLPLQLQPQSGGLSAGKGELRHERALFGVFQRGLHRVRDDLLHALFDMFL